MIWQQSSASGGELRSCVRQWLTILCGYVPDKAVSTLEVLTITNEFSGRKTDRLPVAKEMVNTVFLFDITPKIKAGDFVISSIGDIPDYTPDTSLLRLH